MPTAGQCNSTNYSEYSMSTSNDNDKACFAKYNTENLRSNLQAKKNEITEHPNSTKSISESNFDATMLSGVLWVTLGTTLLYYTFSKL
jgi:uncharacterized iron-regulated protein